MIPTTQRAAILGAGFLDRGLLFNAPLKDSLYPILSRGLPAPTFTRASAGDYLNASGLVASALTDVPRFDYGQSGETRPGLLIEPAATNLLLRSEEFDNATWTKGNATIGANATTAPDGNGTADSIIGSLGTHGVGVRQPVFLSASTIYTVSYFAKSGNQSWIYLEADNKDGTANIVWFNLAAGTIGTVANAIDGSIRLVGNGWYRCSVTFSSATGGATPSLYLQPATADNVATMIGDGATASIYAWGAQLEAGSAPTAYIPTTTTTVTRAKDAFSYSAAGNIQYQGGVVDLWCYRQSAAPPANRLLLDTTASGPANGLQIYLTAAGAIVAKLYGSDGSSSSVSKSGFTANAWHNVCVGWTMSAGYKLLVDGVDAGAWTGSLTASLTAMGSTIYVGSDASGANQWNGRLRNPLIYGPTRTGDTVTLGSRLTAAGVN